MPIQQQHTCCIPRFNKLCRCQCKQGSKSGRYCIDTDCWDSIDRWPKSTFAKDIAIKSKGVAQYQIASELLAGSCINMTIHSDGTTKHDRSYTTFDLVNQEGKLLVCGLREVRATDAQSQLDLFCEILDDVSSSV